MKMNPTLRIKVMSAVQRLRDLHAEGFKGDFREYQKKADAAMAELSKIDEELRPKGFVPGRLAEFGVADGTAVYVVGDIGEETCEMIHAPIYDAYRSDAVNSRGRAFVDVVEENVRRGDALHEMFKKK